MDQNLAQLKKTLKATKLSPRVTRLAPMSGLLCIGFTVSGGVNISASK